MQELLARGQQRWAKLRLSIKGSNSPTQPEWCPAPWHGGWCQCCERGFSAQGAAVLLEGNDVRTAELTPSVTAVWAL